MLFRCYGWWGWWKWDRYYYLKYCYHHHHYHHLIFISTGVASVVSICKFFLAFLVELQPLDSNLSPQIQFITCAGFFFHSFILFIFILFFFGLFFFSTSRCGLFYYCFVLVVVVVVACCSCPTIMFLNTVFDSHPFPGLPRPMHGPLCRNHQLCVSSLRTAFAKAVWRKSMMMIPFSFGSFFFGIFVCLFVCLLVCCFCSCSFFLFFIHEIYFFGTCMSTEKEEYLGGRKWRKRRKVLK